MNAKKLILLVEDNPDDEALSLRALARSGVSAEIMVVRNGAEALEYLQGTGEYEGRDTTVQPTVVLLDLKLPKIDGLEVLRRIRGYPPTRHLPVVLLTSSHEEVDLRTGYALGANSYVRKPVDYERYSDAVGRVGSYWLDINKPAPREGS